MSDYCNCLRCPCRVPNENPRRQRCDECRQGNCMDWRTAKRARKDDIVVEEYDDFPDPDDWYYE